MSSKKQWEEIKEKVREMGYVVENRGNSIWSFSKNGERSVLGFDREGEVMDFIIAHEPSPNKIFPPYK